MLGHANVRLDLSSSTDHRPVAEHGRSVREKTETIVSTKTIRVNKDDRFAIAPTIAVF